MDTTANAEAPLVDADHDVRKRLALVLDLDDLVSVSLEVTNAGACEGVETVFLFSRDPVAQVTRPMLELRDFTKVALRVGETRTIVFVLKARDLCYLDEDRKPRLDDGVIQFHVGASAHPADLDRVDIVIAQGSSAQA